MHQSVISIQKSAQLVSSINQTWCLRCCHYCTRASAVHNHITCLFTFLACHLLIQPHCYEYHGFHLLSFRNIYSYVVIFLLWVFKSSMYFYVMFGNSFIVCFTFEPRKCSKSLLVKNMLNLNMFI